MGRRLQAGLREIRNKNSKEADERRKKKEQEEKVTPEEHERRLEELKKIGLIK